MPTLEEAKSWYPQNDPVHSFDHVLRVYYMAEKLAFAENADLEIVRAAALLHDAHGSETEGGNQGRVDHHHDSAKFARKVLQVEGWSEEPIAAVLHCIRAHRFRDNSEQPQTLEAKILFDADKLDAMGAIGITRTIAFAVVASNPIYAEPSERFKKTGKTEPGESHSSYHEHIFKLSKIKDMLFTRKARSLAEERHHFMTDFFARIEAEMRGER